MNNNTNFIAAVILSIAILVGFHYLYEKPQMEKMQHQVELQKIVQEATPKKVEQLVKPALPRGEVVAQDARVKIATPEVEGSINLKGARLDDLRLVHYREEIEKTSPDIVLLSPAGTAAPYQPYYASFGWLAPQGVKVPNDDTMWKADSKLLTPTKPIRLTWSNGAGLLFERTIAVDDHFLFTISDRVTNKGGKDVTLYPYGLVSRRGEPFTQGTYVLHEGPLGVLDGTLKEIKYKTIIDDRKISVDSTGGWLGITDKYWLVSLLPPQDQKLNASFVYEPSMDSTVDDRGIFQTDYRLAPVTIGVGSSSEMKTHLFAGAKRVSLLDMYEKQLGLPLFDRAIDFGWYYYLTKPFLYFLDEMSGLFGSMALAIVVLTVLLKILTLPLSLKSYRSMARMKLLQPEIKALQERLKEDRQRLGVEMMELYKREKVNPMSGCLPMLFQIPIFFALYKVLYVGIELRHAPLFGWIYDMSAPDPTSVLTGFGAINLAMIPHIGVWPILMGISMFLQQKLTPQSGDQSQAKMLQFLPLIFTFMLANVAAGLIFYWTVSNLLGIAQQWYVMHKIKGLHAK